MNTVKYRIRIAYPERTPCGDGTVSRAVKEYGPTTIYHSDRYVVGLLLPNHTDRGTITGTLDEMISLRWGILCGQVIVHTDNKVIDPQSAVNLIIEEHKD